MQEMLSVGRILDNLCWGAGQKYALTKKRQRKSAYGIAKKFALKASLVQLP